jgi:serine/threonine protein kinase
VKLLYSMSQRLDYEEEFMKEFENLRRLNHSNIVQLFGYCYEIKRVCVEYEGRSVLADKIYRALCFEYMCNGSLQRHLDGEMMVLYIIYWQCFLSLHFVHLPSVCFCR